MSHDGASGGAEVERVTSVYDRYRTAGYDQRWDDERRGNRQMVEERHDHLRTAIGAGSPVGQRILDLGCGSGKLFPFLISLGFLPTRIVGVDLLADRLHHARALRADVPLLRADGRELPLVDGSVGLATVQTVFSSVLDDDVAASIARELDRVLAPGGVVLAYDLRVPNPMNRSVRPVSPAALARWFPGYDVRSHTLTVVPPLARAVGVVAPPAYGLLARLPILRTHRFTVLTKANR